MGGINLIVHIGSALVFFGGIYVYVHLQRKWRLDRYLLNSLADASKVVKVVDLQRVFEHFAQIFQFELNTPLKSHLQVAMVAHNWLHFFMEHKVARVVIMEKDAPDSGLITVVVKLSSRQSQGMDSRAQELNATLKAVGSEQIQIIVE